MPHTKKNVYAIKKKRLDNRIEMAKQLDGVRDGRRVRQDSVHTQETNYTESNEFGARHRSRSAHQGQIHNVVHENGKLENCIYDVHPVNLVMKREKKHPSLHIYAHKHICKQNKRNDHI